MDIYVLVSIEFRVIALFTSYETFLKHIDKIPQMPFAH